MSTKCVRLLGIFACAVQVVLENELFRSNENLNFPLKHLCIENHCEWFYCIKIEWFAGIKCMLATFLSSQLRQIAAKTWTLRKAWQFLLQQGHTHLNRNKIKVSRGSYLWQEKTITNGMKWMCGIINYFYRPMEFVLRCTLQYCELCIVKRECVCL